MEKNFLSRQYLDSMSTADLITLADDYGIDIPDNLNRRFIIGELLETAEELNENHNNSEAELKQLEGNTESVESSKLPKSYNQTSIYAILRNPAWAYVYWDISEADLNHIKTDSDITGLMLYVSFYETNDSEKPTDSFEVQIKNSSREQYILIPQGKKFFNVNLVYSTSTQGKVLLANTTKQEISSEGEVVRSFMPGKKIRMSPLVKLSGMEDLLHYQYINHRESFSN